MSVNYCHNTETTQQVVQLGIKKANTPNLKCFILGIMGGVFVSIGYIGAMLLMGEAHGILSTATIKMLGALVFPVGLMLVVFLGADLFTGNSLITLALYDKKIKLKQLCTNWTFCWIGNFVGAILAAISIVIANIANPSVISYIIYTVDYKLNLGAWENIASGFFCNLLVAGSIWISLGAKEISGKVLVMYLPIFLFVICGFQHCVANMFIFSWAIMLGGSFDYIIMIQSLILSTIGNALSGGILLPLVYKFIYLNKPTSNIVQ